MADDGAIVASIVVHINNAQSSAGIQAALHEIVVVGEVGRVERASEVISDKILPAYREPEGIQAIVVDEMIDLGNAFGAWVHNAARVTSALDVTAEV